MKFWARMFAAGFASAALLGAAQLGVVSVLDALRLDRDFTMPTSASQNDWNVLLTWIAWYALLSVVGGAAFAASQAQLITHRVGVLVRIAVASSAALGALVAILPLVYYSTLDTKLKANMDPNLTMTITVCGAVMAGAFLAALIAANPPLTTSVAVFALAGWVLAMISMADTNTTLGQLHLDSARLGVLDIGALQPIPRASFSLPVLAVVLGAAVAIYGRIRNHSRILIAVSGATGPLLIALAYLFGGPGISREVTTQADAYLGAMIAVVAGLIPAAIIALLPSVRRRRVYANGR